VLQNVSVKAGRQDLWIDLCPRQAAVDDELPERCQSGIALSRRRWLRGWRRRESKAGEGSPLQGVAEAIVVVGTVFLKKCLAAREELCVRVVRRLSIATSAIKFARSAGSRAILKPFGNPERPVSDTAARWGHSGWL
jgi:hypothetical protein